MLNHITKEHPRSPQMRLAADINNVGMCAHMLKHMNTVMAESAQVLREQRATFVDQTAEGLELDHFTDNALRLEETLSFAQLYTPDCGAALSALAAKLPKLDRVEGAA